VYKVLGGRAASKGETYECGVIAYYLTRLLDPNAARNAVGFPTFWTREGRARLEIVGSHAPVHVNDVILAGSNGTFAFVSAKVTWSGRETAETAADFRDFVVDHPDELSEGYELGQFDPARHRLLFVGPAPALDRVRKLVDFLSDLGTNRRWRDVRDRIVQLKPKVHALLSIADELDSPSRSDSGRVLSDDEKLGILRAMQAVPLDPCGQDSREFKEIDEICERCCGRTGGDQMRSALHECAKQVKHAHALWGIEELQDGLLRQGIEVNLTGSAFAVADVCIESATAIGPDIVVGSVADVVCERREAVPNAASEALDRAKQCYRAGSYAEAAILAKKAEELMVTRQGGREGIDG
jgi:hypothetical protein